MKRDLEFSLGNYQIEVEKRLQEWKEKDLIKKLWAKDSTLWISRPDVNIAETLGWLALPEMMVDKMDELSSFVDCVKSEDIDYVVLLGMGGSSLAPEVFQGLFGNAPEYPKLLVLDSTHPEEVRSLEDKIDLTQTLFLVSSKSGTTVETLSLFQYFWEKVGHITQIPGHHFIAITDSGSPLEDMAQERNFRQIFLAPQDVGGRFSALDHFGMVPAALIGVDVKRLLSISRSEAQANSHSIPTDQAPGFKLGAALGEVGKERDKLTFVTSSSFGDFPAWLEQLIAESIGKDGKGIIPIVDEPLVSVENYRNDRCFVFFELDEDENNQLKDFKQAVEKAGHPIISIPLATKYDIGREIFRWEIAVPILTIVLGVQPFDQPDVILTKELTRKVMQEKGEKEGRLIEGKGTYFLDSQENLLQAMRKELQTMPEKGYIALQPFLPRNPEVIHRLQRIRSELLGKTRCATTLGFGPRFLHSTGQLHKGGPKNGLFIQIVDEPDFDLQIPETDYSFAALIKAQSLGDYQALLQRDQSVIRVNLESDIEAGLEKLQNLISKI